MIEYQIFRYVFVGLALNSIFNSLAFAFGYGFPVTSFLFPSADLLADFFKTNFAIASELGIYIDPSELPELIRKYLNSNAYLKDGGITIFHLPPLTMLLSIGIVFLMELFGPINSLLLLLSIFFITVYASLIGFGLSAKRAGVWIAIFLMSYPVLFLITRGNLISGFATLFIALAIILFLQEKKLFWALIFSALAVNMRPNLIILLSVVFIRPYGFDFKRIFSCAFLILIVFFSSLELTHKILDGYTYLKFLNGLKIYHDLFISGAAGVNYGSSLYGAFRTFFPYSQAMETGIFLVCSGLFLYCTTIFFFKKLDLISYIFSLSALCCLMTPIFADYHLTIFFLPLLLISVSCSKSFLLLDPFPSKKVITILIFACTMLLIPKNYAFYKGEISWQVILNPLILLGTLFIILFTKIRRNY